MPPGESRQPGDLGVLRGVIHGFSEEARTLGFASLTFVRFAFVGCTDVYVGRIRARQFGDVPKLESV